MAEKPQRELLAEAKKALGCTDSRMAEQLGVSVKALRSWKAKVGASNHRTMPEIARLLLARIVREAKAKK